MALTSRIDLTGPPESEPEDFLGSSLGVIFPDDVTTQHGDSDHGLLYTSPHLPKPLHISLADPKAEEDRHLFSHYLWNSSLLLAELVEAGTLGLAADGSSSSSFFPDGEEAAAPESAEPLSPPVSEFDVRGLRTVELGAGTALPSIMAALLGARHILVTDYPAPPVMETLRQNVEANTQPALSPFLCRELESVRVDGHSWGELSTPLALENRHAFDRVFVADCLWMPWQHENLRRSIEWFLGDGPGARAWVVAGFHTGREKLRGFFAPEALAAVGLEVERIWERDCDGRERAWVLDRGIEDPSIRKRWLVVAILRRASPAKP